MAAVGAGVEAEHGAVGALVNNAGYSQSGAVESVPIDEVRRQFETNVFGLVRMCQLVLPGMRAQRAGGSSTSPRWGPTSPSRAAASTTPPSTRSRRSATRCASRSRASASRVDRPARARSAPTSARRPADRPAATPAEGPYAEFNAAVAKATQDVYDQGRRCAHLGGPPEAVAKAIERAITSKSPRIRYRVTPTARLLIGQRALMTDGMWDRFVGTQFPRPGAQ